MSRLLTVLFQPVKMISQGLQSFSQTSVTSSLVKPDYFSLLTIRTNVRCHFPRPNEVKRVRRHGWATRISTPSGRRIIMRRLLKGRFVLSH